MFQNSSQQDYRSNHFYSAFLQIQLFLSQQLKFLMNQNKGATPGLQFQQQRNTQLDLPDFMDIEHGPLPQAKRQCRDICCFIFYFMNVVAMIVMSTWAFFSGTPSNIYRATDSNMNICGQRNTPLQNFKYSYFYNPALNNIQKRVCVKNCPNFINGALQTLECYPGGPTCIYNITINQNGSTSATLSDNGDYFIGYQAVQRLDRICLPEMYVLKGPFRKYSTAIDHYLDQSNIINFISDVQNNWALLILGAGISAGIAFIVVAFMKFFPACLVWASLLTVIGTFIVLGFIFLYNGGGILDQRDQIGRLGIPSTQPQLYYNVYGGLSFTVAIILVIIFVCCCSDIHFAISMTRVASKFINQIPTVVLIPIIMGLHIGVFWTTAVSSMIYALSSGNFVANGQVFTIVKDQGQRSLAFLYYFIANAIWTNQIFMTVTVFGVASVAGMWYFTQGPTNQMDKPVWRTLQMIMRYHFGSLAFGSLSLLFAQVLQIFVDMIRYGSLGKYRSTNGCVQIISKCLRKFLHCIQRIVWYFNRFAYIQIALRGRNFIDSSADGSVIMDYNPLRYSFMLGVGSMVFFLVKLLIAISGVTIFYILATFQSSIKTKLLEPLYFLIIIFVCSFGIASVFVNIFSASIDAIINCFVIDEINQKSKGKQPLYAPLQMAVLY